MCAKCWIVIVRKMECIGSLYSRFIHPPYNLPAVKNGGRAEISSDLITQSMLVPCQIVRLQPSDNQLDLGGFQALDHHQVCDCLLYRWILTGQPLKFVPRRVCEKHVTRQNGMMAVKTL
jgi:hypothetical protein